MTPTRDATPVFSNVAQALDKSVCELSVPYLVERELVRFEAAKTVYGKRTRSVSSKDRATAVPTRDLLQATWNLDPRIYVLVVYTGLENLLDLPAPSDLDRFIGPYARCLIHWAVEKKGLPQILSDLVQRYRQHLPPDDSPEELLRYLPENSPGDLVTVSLLGSHVAASGNERQYDDPDQRNHKRQRTEAQLPSDQSTDKVTHTHDYIDVRSPYTTELPQDVLGQNEELREGSPQISLELQGVAYPQQYRTTAPRNDTRAPPKLPSIADSLSKSHEARPHPREYSAHESLHAYPSDQQYFVLREQFPSYSPTPPTQQLHNNGSTPQLQTFPPPIRGIPGTQQATSWSGSVPPGPLNLPGYEKSATQERAGAEPTQSTLTTTPNHNRRDVSKPRSYPTFSFSAMYLIPYLQHTGEREVPEELLEQESEEALEKLKSLARKNLPFTESSVPILYRDYLEFLNLKGQEQVTIGVIEVKEDKKEDKRAGQLSISKLGQDTIHRVITIIAFVEIGNFVKQMVEQEAL